MEPRARFRFKPWQAMLSIRRRSRSRFAASIRSFRLLKRGDGSRNRHPASGARRSSSLQGGCRSAHAQQLNKDCPRGLPALKHHHGSYTPLPLDTPDSAAPEASLPDAARKSQFWSDRGHRRRLTATSARAPSPATRETIVAATGGHHGTPVPMTRELWRSESCPSARSVLTVYYQIRDSGSPGR